MSKLESAFPVNTTNAPNPGAYEAEPGMTLRDWFAGQAVAGLGAAWSRDGASYQDLAEFSYSIADAMLAERNRTQGDAA